MIINIPSQSTIKEYKYLRNSKQEININQTSKSLDEYMYDKTHKFKNAKTFGLLAAMDLLFSCVWFKTKNKTSLSGPLFMLLVANGIILDLIFSEEKNKKFELNNQDKKLALYRKNGINAVV